MELASKVTDPEKSLDFALLVVRELRAAGFEAYWAGGCVRDRLLGRTPKDYDVATNAQPPQIRQVFGRRRTLPIGAAFGVITVLGPREANQIEVATFRRDAAYSDGRHPDSVAFSTAEEDASRRDFTVNGLFYDPVDQRVIDFVGGQEDLKRGLIRAIGDADKRFSEDKLRLLRAVRFAAALDFTLEENTWRTITQMADQVTVVSCERIAGEMRRILTDPRRVQGARLLVESGLARAVLPVVVPEDQAWTESWEHSLSVLGRLDEPGFPLALATLLCDRVDSAAARRAARRWKLSNDETNRVAWLVEHRAALEGAQVGRWSNVQPTLIAAGAEDLLALDEARRLVDGRSTDDVAWCRQWRARPSEELDPPPYLTGDDLLRHGVAAGPVYAKLLAQVRAAQLDGEIHSKADGMALVDRLLAANGQ